MKTISTLLFGLLFYTTALGQENAQASVNELYREEIASGYKDSVIKSINYVKKGINFCVIGDWGRHGQFYQKKWLTNLVML